MSYQLCAFALNTCIAKRLFSSDFICKGRWQRPIEVSLKRQYVITHISLKRSHRVEQLCPLCQSDPRMTGSARGRQSRKSFYLNFIVLKVPL